MKLRSIALDDEELPETITVSMTVREAVLLAKFLGGTSPEKRDEATPGFGEVGSDIYDCLAGLCNRFWDDGVDDALREP